MRYLRHLPPSPESGEILTRLRESGVARISGRLLSSRPKLGSPPHGATTLEVVMFPGRPPLAPDMRTAAETVLRGEVAAAIGSQEIGQQTAFDLREVVFDALPDRCVAVHVELLGLIDSRSRISLN